MQWQVKIRQWLKGSKERRAATRYPCAGLVAYYWTGGPPNACRVRDISEGGAYIETSDLWAAGTVITLTIQREVPAGAAGSGVARDAGDIPQTLHCDVMRREPSGFSVRFLFLDGHEKRALQEFMRDAVPGVADAVAGHHG